MEKSDRLQLEAIVDEEINAAAADASTRAISQSIWKRPEPVIDRFRVEWFLERTDIIVRKRRSPPQITLLGLPGYEDVYVPKSIRVDDSGKRVPGIEASPTALRKARALAIKRFESGKVIANYDRLIEFSLKNRNLKGRTNLGFAIERAKAKLGRQKQLSA